MATAGAEGLELVKKKAFQVLIDVADSWYPHVGHEAHIDLILDRAYSSDEANFLITK